VQLAKSACCRFAICTRKTRRTPAYWEQSRFWTLPQMVYSGAEGSRVQFSWNRAAAGHGTAYANGRDKHKQAGAGERTS